MHKANIQEVAIVAAVGWCSTGQLLFCPTLDDTSFTGISLSDFLCTHRQEVQR